MATQSETVAPIVDAPPAKTVYDAVLYSFAEDGSATILTRADLDAVNAATHVNAVAMSAEKGTERVADTATVTDTDSIADTDAAEDGECEEACPLVFGEPEPEPDKKKSDEKKSETAPNASLAVAATSQAEVTQSLGDAAGLGASAYSSDDVLCMMYGVDVDKEDAEHKVAFFSVDGAVAPTRPPSPPPPPPRPTSPPDASRLPLRRHPGRATPTRRREEESPRFSGTSGAPSSASLERPAERPAPRRSRGSRRPTPRPSRTESTRNTASRARCTPRLRGTPNSSGTTGTRSCS